MSKIYGCMGHRTDEDTEDNFIHHQVTRQNDDNVGCLINVGSGNDSEKFVDVLVTKDEKDFSATLKVHGKEVAFMLCAEKEDDSVMVKSMVEELKNWLICADYEDMFQVLEELKGLKATLCAYLEDISRMEE